MEGNRISVGLRLLSIIQSFLVFTEGSIQDNYIGCYYDRNNQSSLERNSLQNDANLTIELCIEQCRFRTATYAALQSSKACLCGDTFDVSSPDTSCNSPCPGNQSEYCGGLSGHIAFYSLYSVCDLGYYGFKCDQVCHCRRQAPCDRITGQCSNGCEEKWFGAACNTTYLLVKYIGCFQDGTPRAISPEEPLDDRMTVEFCSDRCISRNNSYAGLQSYQYCFCGETYARYGQINENRCNTPCRANESQICGGSVANSVYSVCPAGYYGPKCHNRCNCDNDSRCVYSTGQCNSTCKAGWTGTSCNIRVCSKENGDCSQNETCTTIDLNFAILTRCQCLSGFERNTFWDACEDRSRNACDGFPKSPSKVCEQQVRSVRVAVGVAIGSAIGSAIITTILISGVIFYRRRRRQEHRNSEEVAGNRSKEEPDVKVDNPVSQFAYETLKRRSEESDSAYTELTGNENRPEAK